ncbi:hypothetical protein Mp_6g11580 [Marchantia polymorpha subsp. ruderalis]|uniref:Uncharacterized protein n=2 Tax=Marchantia polymorpha TaxID=3197 RepID=A0AAF6BQY9_MARPO|nr:hypothetical protein MARPO_0016s0198 [Marchantia polymorpha]BBN14423.1 hypothetical protein Mp_6g11580 [Marchantia polymorpha subsp. ruderalis]|eukprot:PTQ45158.1 hypothetical protein MARPO_0016s0198 [Marchantia polymorpha]
MIQFQRRDAQKCIKNWKRWCTQDCIQISRASPLVNPCNPFRGTCSKPARDQIPNRFHQFGRGTYKCFCTTKVYENVCMKLHLK